MLNFWTEKISEPFGCVAVAAFLHPFTYAKVLVQLGHEPLPPVVWKPFGFVPPVVAYPCVFKYVSHIRKSEGFFGLYTGLAANIIRVFAANKIFEKLSTHCEVQNAKHPDPFAEMDEDVPEGGLICKVWVMEMCHEMAASVCSIVVSHPFQVIMVRQMAQFVGHETNYAGFFASIKEIYNNDGMLGFFAGIVPGILHEVVALVLADVLTEITYEFLMSENKKCSELKECTNGVCSFVVDRMTYPLSLVSRVMAVNGSGLQAAKPTYANWRVCYAQLSAANQLKRGWNMLYRRVANNIK